ncbi:MAG: phosphoenolpyruvate carboxylase, partial [Alphaproteobacteria bacterium]|nr:phosphoenolpyruvate carboxylase [Alphaproteobacteria bacterium]
MGNTDVAVTADAFRGAETKLMPEACRMRDALAEKLLQFQDEARENHLQSPIRRMALHVSGMMQSGEASAAEVSELVRLLTVNAFEYRSSRLRSYVGECDGERNTASLKALFHELAHDDAGVALPFETYRGRVERKALGIVITAHPTFTVSEELTRAQASLAVGLTEDGKALTDTDLDELVRFVASSRHGSPEQIRLIDEQKFALMAINNIHKALRRAYAVALDVAREVYPDQWRSLTPRLLSVATWVGYDLDGRSDIRWSDTLYMRLGVERLGLESYLESLDAIGVAGDGVDQARVLLETLKARVEGDMARLTLDPEQASEVGAFARELAASLETRLVSISKVTDLLTRDIEAGADKAAELAVLRAEMANFGLSFAQTHLRINATQLTNAIRHDLDITTSPEDPANRRRYLADIAELLANVQPETVNFGSIMNERTTAKRVFMLVAKFLKYVDADEPVRFLIAECNTPFTVLCALYFAKQFGVADKIDISPLFETGVALDQGHEIIAELLKNPTYVDYVKTRGRLCMQTGFSDAGRYIGQVPASLAIERIRV